MADKENIIVQLASPERLYTKCYHDFLESKLLTSNEKFIFLVLKRFIDVKADGGEVFPTIDTLCSISGWGNQKVTSVIKSLVDKGIVKKIQRGLTKANLYILADYSAMWECGSVEELKEIAKNEGVKPLTPEEHIAELKKMGYIVEIKEKGLISSTDQSEETSTYNISNYSFSISNDTTKAVKSQAESTERYTLEEIKSIYEYDYLIADRPERNQIIDSVMNVLYNALNTTKPTIRVNGENKPTMVVIGRLMKLNPFNIEYAVEKYQEQTERIKNPEAYILTLLYKSKEQSDLDITNQVRHDMANWNNQE